jgi:hypothetical protein
VPLIVYVSNAWIASKIPIMKDIKLSLKKLMVDVAIVEILKPGKDKDFVTNTQDKQSIYK